MRGQSVLIEVLIDDLDRATSFANSGAACCKQSAQFVLWQRIAAYSDYKLR